MALTATVSVQDNYFVHNPKEFFPSPLNEEAVAELQKAASFADPLTALVYNARTHLSLQLKKEYHPSYALVKGLLEFARPTSVNVTYHKESKSITMDFNRNETNRVVSYLHHVDQELSKETKFKSVLKNVILFEQRVRSEREALYSNLVQK